MGFFSSLVGGGPQKTADYDPGLGGHILGRTGNEGLLGDARNQYGFGPPVYDPKYRILDFTGAETAGQRALTQYGTSELPGMHQAGMASLFDLMKGGTYNPTYNKAMQTFGQLAGGQGNPMLRAAGSGELSPYYKSVLGGTVDDLTRTYQNTTGDIMDQLNTNLGVADDTALLAGQYGGSRGEVARGIVGKEASKQVGRANQALSENMGQAMSTVMNDQFSGARNAQLLAGQTLMDSMRGGAEGMTGLYGQGVDQRLGALNMLPGMGEFGMMGGRLLGEVGGAQRALGQAQTDEAKAKWDFEQNAPWANMGRYAELIKMLGPYMSMGAPQGGGSPLASGIGGALSGYGATGSPWGAGAGALAGVLS
jgi:hypothetical protein